MAYATCAALFLDDNSALRPAFRNVDVTPFMNMCVNDVFEWQNHPNAGEMMRKKTCTAVAAYITEALLRGIRIEVRFGGSICLMMFFFMPFRAFFAYFFFLFVFCFLFGSLIF